MMIGLLLAMALLAGVFGWVLTRPLPVPALPYEFTVEQGTSLKAAMRQLEQAGLMPYSDSLILLARLNGQATQIKAGNYELAAPINSLELLDMLTSGRVSQSSISIIEGWTFSQFRAALNSNPYFRHDSAMMSDKDILKFIGAPETHPEGLFFPDTYFFAKGTSDLSILKRSYQTMQHKLAENWPQRTPDTPLKTPYEALILASIIEKETGQDQDRLMVSSVFNNRLKRGMLLQTDPTVIYGMGERFDGNLRKRDLQTDTPYNTYTRGGLPPTPIALPGLAALQAAQNPVKSRALYFVARGDGSSEFSETLEQHNRAVNKFQR